MDIRNYNDTTDYDPIMEVLKAEKWKSFYEIRKEQYKDALLHSQTLVAYEDEEFVGFVRGISDGCFTLFVPEILIVEKHRNKGYGTRLMDELQKCYPSARMELISDADDFYLKKGFHAVGSGMRKHDWF